MGESRLHYLFRIYINKTATAAERGELMALLDSHENDEEIKALLAESWNEPSMQDFVFDEGQVNEMLSNIHDQEKLQPAAVVELKRSPFRWMRVAAAAILLLAVSGMAVWLSTTSTPSPAAEKPAIIAKADAQIAPGGNKAVLTLANGANILLDSSREGTITVQGHVKVIQLNTGALSYADEGSNEQEVAYNTLSTPKGGQYQVVLADGTRVWLNASSSIRFPTKFTGRERHVSVTGEAYFEVAKKSGMPFSISVNEMRVEVLGTHFNIMAYEDESSINTTLLEGSVKVSKGGKEKILVPGQEAKLGKANDFKIVEPDIAEVMAWKNGWFQFNATAVEDAMRQIARWYDVEVVYEAEVPDIHFSGMVSRQNSLSQVMKIMQEGGLQFRIEGRKLFVLS